MTCEAACGPFTPNKSGQRLRSLYYRCCWHRVSNLLFFGYRHDSSPIKAVYRPKPFIPHAASLTQPFGHWGIFSTAATRRCLGSFSVPVVGVMLSHPLRIVALVSRYLTNQLIRSRPLLRWNLTFAPETITLQEIIGYYPQFPVAIPDPRVRHLPVTTPFAAVPLAGSRSTCMPNPRRQRSF